MKPLNAIAKYALMQAARVAQAYLERLYALLEHRSFDKRGSLRAQMSAVQREWYKEARTLLEQDGRQAIEQGKFDAVSAGVQAVGGDVSSAKMMSAFDNHWSNEIWNFIESERENNGISPSRSLWSAGKHAEQAAYKLIKDAEQQGIPYGKVKKELEKLLTKKGKENIGYNVKRLWVDQVKRNRIAAEKKVWQDMGFKHLILRRSANGYYCEVCGEKVDYPPLSERVVPIDWPDLPPFHPWCQCDVRPEKLTAKEAVAFMQGKIGTPPVRKAATKQNVSLRSVGQAWNEIIFERNIDDAFERMKPIYHWSDKEVQSAKSIIMDAIGNVVRFFEPTEYKLDILDDYISAQYQYWGPRIVINISSTIASRTTAEGMALNIIHEFGHHIEHSMNGDLGTYFVTLTIKDDFERHLGRVLAAIQACTHMIPEAHGTGFVVNPSPYTQLNVNRSVATREAADWLWVMRASDSEKVLSALADMSVGVIGNCIVHSTSYLTNSLSNIFIDGTRYGIAEQESLNQFMEAMLASGGIDDVQVRLLEKAAPGVYQSINDWLTYLKELP